MLDITLRDFKMWHSTGDLLVDFECRQVTEVSAQRGLQRRRRARSGLTFTWLLPRSFAAVTFMFGKL